MKKWKRYNPNIHNKKTALCIVYGLCLCGFFVSAGYVVRSLRENLREPEPIVAGLPGQTSPADGTVLEKEPEKELENMSISMSPSELSRLDMVSYIDTTFGTGYGTMDFDIAASGTDNAIVEIVKADHGLLEKALPVYQYIRDVRPSLSPTVAAIEACSVVYYSAENSLPIGVVVAVIQTESNFRPDARSSAGALGLMQVMWKYHAGRCQSLGIIRESELKDPEKGIRAGTAVLKGYIQAENSITGGLKRYYGVLSNKYISTFQKYWHTFELFRSGIEGNWKMALNNESRYWDTLQRTVKQGKDTPRQRKPRKISKPVSVPADSPSSICIIRSDGTRSKKTISSPNTESSIVIRFENGTVKKWSD